MIGMAAWRFKQQESSNSRKIDSRKMGRVQMAPNFAKLPPIAG
jgi:hypothetical protein